jgi:hypothetical protein
MVDQKLIDFGVLRLRLEKPIVIWQCVLDIGKTVSSTEDETFNRLKSLTYEEVDAMVDECIAELVEETGVRGVLMMPLRERLDPILAPYGWSCDKFFKYHRSDIL